MKKSQKSRRRARAPRVRVPNRERALFCVDQKHFVGVLQRVSMSGGSAVLSTGPIAPGTMGDIALRTMFGKVTAHIEFLQTCADGVPLAQAFRFLAMEEKSSERLLAATQMMEQEGLSDVPPTKSSGHPATETLSLLADSMRRLAAHLLPKR